jgi:phage terminase small subunit
MAEEAEKYTRSQLDEKLTDKELIICHEYIIDWNKARAARAAGYSEDSARQIAYAIFTKDYIKQYIDFIKNDLEIEAGVSKLRNLKELAKIAYSSIASLHDTWIKLMDFNELTEIQKAAIESTETKTMKVGEDGEINIEFVKIKLFPKLPAISEINKMMGYNEPDKVDHTTKGKSLNDISKLSTEDLVARANAMSIIDNKDN